MKNFARVYVTMAVVALSLFAMAGIAGATVDSSVVTLTTTSATDMKDTALAVITAIVPLAVAVLLAMKAIPWARKFLHV